MLTVVAGVECMNAMRDQGYPQDARMHGYGGYTIYCDA